MPLLWIIFVVVEFLASVGIADGAPPLTADGVVARVVGCHCRPLPRRRSIPQERHEACALKVVAGGKSGKLHERVIDVEQFHRPSALLPGRDARAGEDQRHSGARFPERFFPGDSFCTKVPAVVAPDDDDRIFAAARCVESGQDPAHLGINKARTSQVAADEVLPLPQLFEQRQPWAANSCGSVRRSASLGRD